MHETRPHEDKVPQAQEKSKIQKEKFNGYVRRLMASTKNEVTLNLNLSFETSSYSSYSSYD